MKQKMPKKAGTIKPNQDDEKSSPTKSSEGQGDSGDQKSKKEQKEADLVERIALDLGNLLKGIFNKTVRKFQFFYICSLLSNKQFIGKQNGSKLQ